MQEDIWKQPSKGFTLETKGRTELQLQESEALIGFQLPTLYRAHMKIQNGGYLKKCAIKDDNEIWELLYNGAGFDPIQPHGGYGNLEEILLEYLSADEIQNGVKSDFLDLTRLPLLSSMDGHSALCFDYGYNVKTPYKEPQICLFELESVENGFEERWRIESYDALIENLVYYGYESTSFHLGIKTNESIDSIAENLKRVLNAHLEADRSDRYGWYNFDKWYKGTIEINKHIQLYICLTPNQFRNNNYLLQNYKEYPFILDIEIREGVDSFYDNSDYLKERIETHLAPFLNEVESDFLLVPYPHTNQEELTKLKQLWES